MKVTLIGIGMDGERTLTREAAEAIGRAQLLIGAKRMLAPFAALQKRQEACHVTAQIAEMLQAEAAAGTSEAAVLFSGDTGFFSGAKGLLSALDETDGIEMQVLPGISSVACFCARCGLSYENMKIVSLHGRDAAIAVHVLQNERTFFLLGGDVDAASLCRTLCRYHLPSAMVHVGENLGMENERITHGAAEALTELSAENLSVAIVENPVPMTSVPAGIPDAAFERILGAQAGGTRTIPMTKAEVRAVSVGKLEIRRDDVCWDIGCGTGSVSVEMALHCPDGAVYAYDKNPDAVSLTQRNAERFSCDNIRSFRCDFPPQVPVNSRAEAGEDMDVVPVPAPDCVFIGGAGGKIGAMTDLALSLNPQVRIVVTAVTLETLEAARAVLTDAFGSCEIVQLAVCRSEPVGGLSMMKAQNPVYILKGVRP